MFTKILVATDASEASNHLLACLADLRKVGAQFVVLVHVINVETVGAPSHAVEWQYRGEASGAKPRPSTNGLRD